MLLFSMAVIPLLWLAVTIGRECSTSHDIQHLVKQLPFFGRRDVGKLLIRFSNRRLLEVEFLGPKGAREADYDCARLNLPSAEAAWSDNDPLNKNVVS